MTDDRITLPKVDETRNGDQEGASPKFPRELMVTVACSGEALKQPNEKERCDLLAENVGDGLFSISRP